MHCGVMVTGYNQSDWPRLMAGDYERAPDVADYLKIGRASCRERV